MIIYIMSLSQIFFLTSKASLSRVECINSSRFQAKYLCCNYLKCVLSVHVNNAQQGKKHVNNKKNKYLCSLLCIFNLFNQNYRPYSRQRGLYQKLDLY